MDRRASRREDAPHDSRPGRGTDDPHSVSGDSAARLGQTTTYGEGDRKGQVVTNSVVGTPGPFAEIGLAWDTPRSEHKSPRFEPYAIYFTHRTGSNDFDGRLGSWMSFLQLGIAMRFGS